jgi:hypothetical protein
MGRDITQLQADEMMQCYGLINGYLFGNQLTNDVRLTLTYKTKGDGGLFIPNKWEDSGGVKRHEIIVDENLLDLPGHRWVESLVHQMVHLLQYDWGVSPTKHYHNKEFATTIESFGFTVESEDKDRPGKVGQSVTYTANKQGRYQDMIQIIGGKLVLTHTPRNGSSQAGGKNGDGKYVDAACHCGVTHHLIPGSRLRCEECGQLVTPLNKKGEYAA